MEILETFPILHSKEGNSLQITVYENNGSFFVEEKRNHHPAYLITEKDNLEACLLVADSLWEKELNTTNETPMIGKRYLDEKSELPMETRFFPEGIRCIVKKIEEKIVYTDINGNVLVGLPFCESLNETIYSPVNKHGLTLDLVVRCSNSKYNDLNNIQTITSYPYANDEEYFEPFLVDIVDFKLPYKDRQTVIKDLMYNNEFCSNDYELYHSITANTDIPYFIKMLKKHTGNPFFLARTLNSLYAYGENAIGVLTLEKPKIMLGIIVENNKNFTVVKYELASGKDSLINCSPVNAGLPGDLVNFFINPDKRLPATIL